MNCVTLLQAVVVHILLSARQSVCVLSVRLPVCVCVPVMSARDVVSVSGTVGRFFHRPGSTPLRRPETQTNQPTMGLIHAGGAHGPVPLVT